MLPTSYNAYRTHPAFSDHLWVVDPHQWNEEKRRATADGYHSVDLRRRELDHPESNTSYSNVLNINFRV